MNSLELLMPAGSLEKLDYAFAYGADAVYAGVPLFSLRARENEFKLEELQIGVSKAHELGKKVYLTANIFARNLKMKPFMAQLDQWAQLKPDAFIMSDPGLIMMAKERHPQIPIHLSVQANCMNYQSVKFWQKVGVERVILSRELRLTEIAEIKQQVPEIELEAFVHGSICIAYSGRCLLSHYMSYRDANQGVCDNSCRYGYNIYNAKTKVSEGEFYLEDLRNKGELYPIDEDENGTYIMNSKDLCLIEHLKELADAGVCSFKVEGRTKSVHYVAQVSRIYRKAIDDLQAGRPFDSNLMNELEKVANRGYHKGFFMGQPSHEAQNYDHSVARHFTQKFAGITHQGDDGKVRVEVRNRIQVGDQLEVIDPQQSYVDTITGIVDQFNSPTQIAHGGTGNYFIQLASQKELKPQSILSQLLKESKPDGQ